MKNYSLTLTPRALARGMRILVLASCLMTGAALDRPAAHAAPTMNPSIIIYGPCGSTAKHNVVSAYGFTRAIDATVYVTGTCFRFFSTARITITDLTTGTILAHSVAVPVGITGGFQYQALGAYADDKVRVRVTDGTWHKTLTFTVSVSIP